MTGVAALFAVSGYRPLYRGGDYCPSCAASAWLIGRVSAECARCGTALPLAPGYHTRKHEVGTGSASDIAA